ncbi:uroporphyrinogen-III synthase [Mesoterricola silvestris]|nr:uroporphyrinogen-III synthase [Mesoterricola silvestris]
MSRAVAAAGWEPVPYHVTAMEATGAPAPHPRPDGVIVLSPTAARLARIPPGVPCLAQGAATARALEGREVLTSALPQAEGLVQLLKDRFPGGGTFLLARAERSREHLEDALRGTVWSVLPWITHREVPLDPPPAPPALDAVLALSPLQAEVLGPLSGDRLRLAWGERTDRAFAQVGYPSHGWCVPQLPALQQLLSSRG